MVRDARYPSEFPMIVQAISGIVCNTQKTMAFLLSRFLCRHGFLERMSVSRQCLFFSISFYVSARAGRDDTTTVTRLFVFICFFLHAGTHLN